MVHGTGFVARLDGFRSGRAPGRENAISTIASAAVAAPPMKMTKKLLSIGTPVPATIRLSSTATSAAAVELPIVRAIAFMLVATPVSPASTSLTTSAGSAP